MILVILYFVVPVDIFPDFLGLPGRIDDFVVALVGLYYMVANSGKSRGPAAGGPGERTAADPNRKKRGSAGVGDPETGTPAPPDPYDVLGVPRGATLADVRRVYREKLLQYHPDRLQHLGREFRELAEEKTRELNEAFGRIEQQRNRAG